MSFNKQRVRRAFNRGAKHYNQINVVQREIGNRLLERLDLMRIEPRTILDVGSGTGQLTQQLQERYPKASVFACDMSEAMLQSVKQTSVCADVERMPFANNAFDLIVSNLLLHWCNNLSQAFKELQKILKPNGLLLFSTLGPDTYQELRESWASVDRQQHVHEFLDMHDIGDMLLQARFSDPVMDMEKLVFHYESPMQVMQDLKQGGMENQALQRPKGLITHSALQKVCRYYQQFANQEGLVPATFEVLYGHAWGTENLATADKSGEVAISINDITRT